MQHVCVLRARVRSAASCAHAARPLNELTTRRISGITGAISDASRSKSLHNTHLQQPQRNESGKGRECRPRSTNEQDIKCDAQALPIVAYDRTGLVKQAQGTQPDAHKRARTSAAKQWEGPRWELTAALPREF